MKKLDIKITSATGEYQLETGDVYVWTKKGKKTKDVILVANILGLNIWNVIFVIKDGKTVDRKVLYENVGSRDKGIELAKKELEKMWR